MVNTRALALTSFPHSQLFYLSHNLTLTLSYTLALAPTLSLSCWKGSLRGPVSPTGNPRLQMARTGVGTWVNFPHGDRDGNPRPQPRCQPYYKRCHLHS